MSKSKVEELEGQLMHLCECAEGIHLYDELEPLLRAALAEEFERGRESACMPDHPFVQHGQEPYCETCYVQKRLT